MSDERFLFILKWMEKMQRQVDDMEPTAPHDQEPIRNTEEEVAYRRNLVFLTSGDVMFIKNEAGVVLAEIRSLGTTEVNLL